MLTFKKRPGTTDIGKNYEDIMTAHFALKFTLQEDVENFQMSSNDDDFGDFDDVVMNVSFRNRERVRYAIQLKHSLHNKPLMSEDLMASNGGFSLQKYFEEFTKNHVEDKKFVYVLYTNRTLKSSNKVLRMKGKEHFTVEMHEVQRPCVVLSTSKDGKQYKCEIRASDDSLRDVTCKAEYEEYEEFFKHFLLCTDQSGVSGMEAILSETFEGEFGLKNESYLEFVTKWSQCDGQKLFLDKETVKFKLGECLLSTYCSEHICVPNIDSYAWETFKETILQFDITILQTVQNVSRRSMVDDLDSLDGNDIERTGRKYGLSLEEPKQKLKILWHLNKVPLIVRVDESNQELVLKTVKLCKGKKFVLCGGSVTRTDLVGLDVFENVCDLDRVNSNIVEKCMVSIQGKQKVGVEEILEHDGVKPLVTTSALLEMLGEYRIGEKQDELPEYYINRSLTKTMLDLKCLEKTESSDFFVVSCEKSVLQPLVKNQVIDLDDYLSDIRQNQSDENLKMILTTNHQYVTSDQLDKIAARNPYKVCHHVHLVEDDKLELITSEGSIENLKQFRLTNTDYFIDEAAILKSEHNVNIVCSAPGMGKSVLMKFLKINYSSEYWVTYIDLKLYYSFFKSNDSCDTILSSIDNIESGDCSELDKMIKKSFQKTKKLVFLWDALDEVPVEQVEVIVGAILKLKDYGIRQWIASRPHLQTLLENKFDAFASNIVELSESQQKEYINRRLDKTKAMKLHAEIQRMRSDYLGVPLLLFILTELFLRKKDEWNFSSGMARSVLYRYFIEEQFQAYYAKAKCNLTNHIMRDILNEYQSNRLEQYELMGAVSCFGDEIVKKKTNYCTVLEKFVSDGVGIITGVRNGSPVFFHRTFGEYFAACWLTKNHSKVANLATLIFQEDFRGVRFMLDSILAEDCPAHLAVLHQDLEGLKKCSKEICERKDKGGRNVLQVLSSWGRTYPLLIVNRLEDKYLVDSTPGDTILNSILRKLPCSSEEVAHKNLLTFAIESNWCDPLDKDTLFGRNTYFYADAALCLYSLEMLLTKHTINFTGLNNYRDVCTVMFYSVICNYDFLFGTIGILPQIQFVGGLKFLHLATQCGNCNCLLKMLNVELYKGEVNEFLYLVRGPEWFQWKFIDFGIMNINCPYKTTNETNSPIPFGLSPLHVASQEGDLNMVRILIQHKAKVDSLNSYQVTPLQLAVIEGHVEIVKYLVKKNAKTDVDNLSGFKLLHLAAYYGHLDVMKFLISKKIGKVDCKARYYDITPLHVAAANGKLKAMQYLVLKGANINAKISGLPLQLQRIRKNCRIASIDIPEINRLPEHQGRKFGAEPLHFASLSGNIAAVKFLVKKGSNVTAKNVFEDLPIVGAVVLGHKNVVEYFVQECGQIEGKTLKFGGINEQNVLGYTCLLHAISHRNYEMSEFLINVGADVEKADTNGYTPSLFCAIFNSVRILELLIKKGGNIHAADVKGHNLFQLAACHDSIDIFKFLKANDFDINIKDKDGNNLLHLAANTGSFEVAKVLIEDKIIRINQPNKVGFTPLHEVVRYLTSKHCHSKEDPLKLLTLLLDHNADVDGSCSWLATPLQYATNSERFCPETVKLLVKNGAKTNIVNQNWMFPLLGCTKHGNLETVQLLLESGANPYLCDEAGNNCLHYACLMGLTEIVRILLKYADPNTVNKRGQTPLHLACTRTNLKVIAALIEKGAQTDIADHKGSTATLLLLKTVNNAMSRNRTSTT